MQKLGLEEVKGLVAKILDKSFHGNPGKQKIYSSTNRLNFSCPYCGDSSDPRKKRGNLYLDSLSFKCYNGGCGQFRDLIGLLYDHELSRELTIEQLEEAKNTITLKKSNRRISANIDVFILENYRDVLVEREFYKNKLKLIEIPRPIKEYLTSRNQITDEKYLYCPIKKSIHILNLTSDGKYILGLQLRNMKKNAVNKYFTYRLSGIHKNLLRNFDPTILSKAEELDPISLVFGFSSVNLDETVTIFEGPLDSFLFPNAVALCSINNPFPFDIPNKRWFYDGDEAGRDALRKKLSTGDTVFLWDKFIKDNDLPERDKWDLNDLVNYLRESGKKIKRLEKYFSNEQWDLIGI
jgi:hypothetical protein